MDGTTYAARTKQQLIDQVHAEQAAWEALLAEMGPDRLEIPGVTDAWTMKDTIAHLATWWRREVARLAAVQRGERPPAHPAQSEVAIINQWIYLVNGATGRVGTCCAMPRPSGRSLQPTCRICPRKRWPIGSTMSGWTAGRSAPASSTTSCAIFMKSTSPSSAPGSTHSLPGRAAAPPAAHKEVSLCSRKN